SSLDRRSCASSPGMASRSRTGRSPVPGVPRCFPRIRPRLRASSDCNEMRLTARAPATVANLGSGFDCLALAVGLSSEFSIDTEAEPGVEVGGEGSAELPADGTNLTFRTISYLGQRAGGKLPPFRLTCRNGIPLQRGLGSSAAAVVAGLLLGDRLLGSNLSNDELLHMAVDLEGHADNVAACLR